MTNRYRKIKYNKFHRGSGQKIYDHNLRSRFNTSENLKLNSFTNRFNLAEKFDRFTVENTEMLANDNLLSTTYPYGTGNRMAHLLYDTVASVVKLYRQIGQSTPYAVSTFIANSTNPHLLVSYKGLLLAFYDIYSTLNFKWSDDDGSTFNIGTWAYGDPRGFKITGDNTLYIFTDDEIVTTTDGKTFTLFYDASDEEYNISSIEELDGVLYALFNNFSLFCYFVKFDYENNPVIIREIWSRYYIALGSDHNRIIIAVNRYDHIRFYEYDKADLNAVAYYPSSGIANMRFLASDNEYLYFVAGYTQLLRINRNNGVYHLITSDYPISSILNFTGDLCLVSNDGAGNEVHTDFFNRTYQATGNFTTSKLDERHVPAYVILKHAPLGDDATITIKAKQNGEATFATTILTNTENDSVRTEVALVDLLDECDSIELEVTLADSSFKGEIEDLELIYLYISTGLENSK